jgi:hypothetical protein
MSRGARASALAAFLVLLLLGALSQTDTRVLSPTSFGRVAPGQGAFYDLLRELGLPVARSFSPPERLPTGTTVWWIEPQGLGPRADAPEALSGKAQGRHPGEPSALAGDRLAAWIQGGGTAVVLLPRLAGDARVLTLADVALPARHALAAPEAKGRPSPRSRPPQRAGSLDEQEQTSRVEGGLAQVPRTLLLPRPTVFRADDPQLTGFAVAARLEGQPFVLERRIGAGRLVVAADARFVWNEWLDRADSALLAFDLVRRYGTPWIDEHEHGFTTPRGAVSYLVRSPALAFFVGLGLLALAIAWRGAADPPRRVPDADPAAPTLESFVDSLARLYAATGDHARVLERSREVAARRLRRGLGLSPDTPMERLLERLARRRRPPHQGLSILTGGARVRNATELERAIVALDRFVEEVRS